MIKQKDFASARLMGSVANVAGGLVTLLGTVVIFGWFTDSSLLVQLRSQWVPMQFNTALGFVLCGGGLLFLNFNRRHMAMACGGLSLGLGLLTLLQYYIGLDLGIDRFFMEPSITTKTAYPGRMAQATALAHLLSGLALVLVTLPLKRPLMIFGLLGSIIAAIGAGTLFGYLLGRDTPFAWSHLTYMAVHTAFGFLILGIGMLAFATRATWVKGARLDWIPAVAGIAFATLTVSLWQALLSHEQEQVDHAVAQQSTILMKEITDSMNHQVLALDRMARRWEQQGGTPQASWKADAAHYIEHNPGLQAISWVDSSMTVRWIEPLQGNVAARDLYLPFEPRRALALETARRERVTSATRNIELVQGGKAIIVYFPLYIDDRFDGFIGGVFRIDKLLAPIFTDLANKDFGLELFEGDEEIYRRMEPGVVHETGLSQEQTFAIVNLDWRLSLQPNQTLLAELRSPLPLITLMAGLLLALLLSLAIHFSQAARRRAETLTILNRELAAENKKRKETEQSLKESELWQRGIFDTLEEGVMVATPERVMLSMNPACQTMLGYSQAEIAGQPTAMVHVDPEHVVEFGRRIKAAFDQSESARFEFELKRKNGEVFPSEHTASLIKDAQGEAIGIVSTLADITARKQVEAELHRHREHLQELVTERTRELEATNVHLHQEIAEHQRTEETLRQSEQQYRTLFETMAEGVVYQQRSGEITAANPAAERILGMTFDQMQGRTSLDPRWRCIREDGTDFPGEEHPSMVALETGEPVKDKIMGGINPRDGQQHWILVNAVPEFRPGEDQPYRVYTTFSDITRLREGQRALQASEQYLRTMFDNMQEGVITTDGAGMIESVNPAILTMFGYEHSQLMGQSVGVLMPKTDSDGHERHLAQHREEWGDRPVRNIIGSRQREFTALHANGSRFDINLILGEMQLGDQRKFIAIVRDISESKLIREELEHSRQQLRDLAAHLQIVREEERARIARDVHDELGQVLTALNMDAHWLSLHIPEEVVELQKKTLSMLVMINTAIESVQRITSELRPAMLDELGLGPAIQWYLEELQGRTGINCESALAFDDMALDSGRATTVFRILQEALTNVARHAEAEQVSIDIHRGDGHLEMQIIDNGIGISPSAAAADNAFGLLGMKERAFAFGGTVEIDGRPGKGTTVSLHLPLNHEPRET